MAAAPEGLNERAEERESRVAVENELLRKPNCTWRSEQGGKGDHD